MIIFTSSVHVDIVLVFPLDEGCCLEVLVFSVFMYLKSVVMLCKLVGLSMVGCKAKNLWLSVNYSSILWLALSRTTFGALM